MDISSAHRNGNDKLKKLLKELLLDATVGLVKQYQAKTLKLVKIEAVSAYVRSIRILRHQALLFTKILFLVAVIAVAVVIVPLVLLGFVPWPKEVKLVLALLIGIGDICVPLFLLKHWLSEENWMELTKSNELMDTVMKNN